MQHQSSGKVFVPFPEPTRIATAQDTSARAQPSGIKKKNDSNFRGGERVHDCRAITEGKGKNNPEKHLQVTPKPRKPTAPRQHPPLPQPHPHHRFIATSPFHHHGIAISPIRGHSKNRPLGQQFNLPLLRQERGKITGHDHRTSEGRHSPRTTNRHLTNTTRAAASGAGGTFTSTPQNPSNTNIPAATPQKAGTPTSTSSDNSRRPSKCSASTTTLPSTATK